MSQTIHLSGKIDSDPITLTSSSVSVHCSRQPTTPPQTGSNLQVKSEASNRVQVQNLANQQWDLKRLTDNLICENENYLAYILHGKSGCIVRLMHKQSEQRQLIKSFTSTVVDLVFVHVAYDMIACLELSGTVTVWLISSPEPNSESTDKAATGSIDIELILKITRPEVEKYNTLRIVWCNLPFITLDSTESLKSVRSYSRFFCVTLNDKCEVWDLDKATEMQKQSSGNMHITAGEENNKACCIVVQNAHNGEILDVAFSPDEAYLATSGRDGAVKCWSIEMNKCVHKLNPHEGFEVSQIKFLDDLTYSTRNEAHTDSFWQFILTLSRPKCEIKLWSCTDWGCLQSVTFQSSIETPPVLRLTTHLSSRFVALCDTQRPLLYLLEFSRETSHFLSLGEFTLIHPILSLSIASLQAFKPTSQPGLLSLGATTGDLLSERYTQIVLHSVHSKSLQELSVCYSQVVMKEDSSSKFPSPSVVTVEEIESSPVLSESSVMTLADNLNSTALTEVTKEESFSDTDGKIDIQDPSLPTESNLDDEIVIPPGPGSGVETMKKLRSMLNLPPPIVSVSMQAPSPLPREDVLKVVNVGAYNYFAADIQQVEAQMEQEISLTTNTVDSICTAEESTLNESSISTSHSSTINTESKQDNSLQQQQLEPIPVECNSPTRPILSQIHQELVEQRKVNIELNREISYISHQMKVLLEKEAHTQQCLTHLLQSQGQLLSMRENERMTEQPRQEKLIASITSSLKHTLTTEINSLICNEINQLVVRVFSDSMNNFQNSLPVMLKTIMNEQMKVIETSVERFLVELMQKQDVIEKVSAQLSQTMSPQVKESHKKVFLEIALPAFDKCCKQMFQQMNDTIVRASQEYAKEMQHCVQVIQENVKKDGEEDTIPNTNLNKEDVLNKCVQIANSIEQLPQVIRDEFQRVLHDELSTWTQSLPSTTSQVSIEQIKTEIEKRLSEGQIAQAFDLALTANNLEAVEYICAQVQPGEVLESEPPILSQDLLLSLVQQLSFDLSSNLQLKLRYLIDAIHSIDPTHEHADQVLRDLLQTLTHTSNQLTSGDPFSIHIPKVNWLMKYVKKIVDALD